MSRSIVVKMLVRDTLSEDMSESKVFICKMIVVWSGCKVIVFTVN